MAFFNVSNGLENQKVKRAIVFVHGLKGSSLTWQGSSTRFVDILKTEPSISGNFGLYIYKYHTKIVEFSFLKKILSIIPGLKKKEFNVGIRRIAMELKSTLYEILKDCNIIVIIAHSMGGLITKRALVEMQEEELKKIRLFISLSVPHLGAGLANTGSTLLRKHIQLDDLRRFSDFTSDLTNRFANINNRPRVIYQAGHQDLIVPEAAAIPASVVADDRIDTNDNHYSVLEISDPSSHIPYRRLIRELQNILIWEQQQSTSNKSNYQVSFTTPTNTSFKSVAEALAETANCTIEFIGFTDQELVLHLKPQEILNGNTFQALESLQFIGEHPIPRYEVKIADSHFKIIKY